jgi:hypothetical protein
MFRSRLASAASIASIGLVAALGGVAHAEFSHGVISAFHGQLVISKDELPEGKNDGDTIKKINAARLKEIGGEKHGDVQAWHFHYTAFLTRGGASQLELEFLNDKGQLSANQRLNDVDPKATVQLGDIAIDEDEGLATGKTYTVELLAGDAVVAKTTLTMK